MLWTYRDVDDKTWEVSNGRVQFFTGSEAAAGALAMQLQEARWQPPAPEPERPPVDHIFAPSMLEEGKSHGYRVVDLQALGDAIEALRSWSPMCVPEREHLRDLLDALGVDRG